MSELYRAIAGSPITYLSSDISAAQTTISIADDSALPDAPNICTIGYGENIETIRYGAKSNGVLQNVTRGIEGTPRAWPAGTEVARFFTAYDHNAIVETINSHLVESAKKHITESGSNSNGHYIKFDDGTMICYHSIDLGSILDWGTGTFSDLYRTLPTTWTYPARFVGAPIITTGPNFGDVTGVNRAICISYSTPRESSVSDIQAFRCSGGNQDTNVTARFIAIGRWR